MKVSRAPRREPTQKSVSVGYELLTLEHAVEGVAALVEMLRLGDLDDRDAERGVSALLALLGCRVRDLGRVVRGAMPADLLLAPHNEAMEAMKGDDPDVLLPAPARPPGRRRQR